MCYIYKLVEEKEVNFFIRKLDFVNSIMKKTSMENGYLINDIYFNSEFFNKSCIPRNITISNIKYNSKEQEILDRLNERIMSDSKNFFPLYVENPIKFFEFYRDNKKIITFIEFSYSDEKKCYQVKILTKNSNISFTIYSKAYYKDIIKKDDILVDDDYTIEFSLADESYKAKSMPDYIYPADNIDEFIKKKGVFNLFLDFDEKRIAFEPYKDTEDYLNFIISHKYLSGFSTCNATNTYLTFRIESIYKELKNTGEILNFDDLLKFTIEINRGNYIVTNSFIIINI